MKRKRSRLKTGGFLNRYDFAYAGRDVVNQVGKVAPKMITQATGEINKIAQERIDQVVRSGGAEIERVAPKIIKGAIEKVYKTPFRLLGNLGKKQFQKIRRKLFKYYFKKQKDFCLNKNENLNCYHALGKEKIIQFTAKH